MSPFVSWTLRCSSRNKHRFIHPSKSISVEWKRNSTISATKTWFVPKHWIRIFIELLYYPYGRDVIARCNAINWYVFVQYSMHMRPPPLEQAPSLYEHSQILIIKHYLNHYHLSFSQFNIPKVRQYHSSYLIRTRRMIPLPSFRNIYTFWPFTYRNICHNRHTTRPNIYLHIYTRKKPPHFEWKCVCCVFASNEVEHFCIIIKPFVSN